MSENTLLHTKGELRGCMNTQYKIIKKYFERWINGESLCSSRFQKSKFGALMNVDYSDEINYKF